jgi:hypothetical protein
MGLGGGGQFGARCWPVSTAWQESCGDEQLWGSAVVEMEALEGASSA